MKNKNLALVAVLFTISVIMAFANGPTPQVVIDTDQIIDGAVTILKTDGVAANDLSNVTPATGRAALGLGTMAVASSTDYVATTALALRLDTVNASFTGDIDVAGDVGADTVNGVAPLTSAEKTQALVGSSTVDFSAKDINATGTVKVGTGGSSAPYMYTKARRFTTVAPDTAVEFFAVDSQDMGDIYVEAVSYLKSARYSFFSNTTTEVKESDTSFTNTKDNAGTYNIYIEGGYIVFQNKTANTTSANMGVVYYGR